MTDEELEQLRQLDWVAIIAKVANYARSRLLNRSTEERAFTKGHSAEDLAFEAIGEFWKKPDRCPTGVDVGVFLCGLVRHKISNMFKWDETKTTQREAELETFGGTDPKPYPDKIAAANDDLMTAVKFLSEHTSVQGKEDHELVVLALGLRLFDAKEIAQETGLTVERVRQVQKELRTIYPHIKKELNTMKGASHDSR